ncbi:unnamed protein product, partial [Cyprideis torosa]
QILDGFRGEITQIPPKYSAIQKNGQRLYQLARKGIDVDIPERQVVIQRLELTDLGDETLSLSVSCSKGTYIRSLVRDIGEAIGCGAHVEMLRRTGVDPFIHPDMLTLDEVVKLAEEGRLEERLLAVDEALVNMASLDISEEQSTRLKNGLRVHLSENPSDEFELVRVYDHVGTFIGI